MQTTVNEKHGEIVRISLLDLEKIFIVGLFIGLYIPLSLNLGLIRIYIWNIPLIILIIITILKRYKNKNWKYRRPDTWEISIISLSTILFFSSLMGENSIQNLPDLSQYIVVLFFGLYMRRNWGNLFTFETLLFFFFTVVFVQSLTGIIQQVTLTQFGNPSAFFGEEQTDNLQDTFGLQISRVQGTLGHPNLVANWLIVAFPFVFISTLKKSFGGFNYWLLKRVAIILFLVGLLFTFSRGSILIFSLITTIFAFLYFILLSKPLKIDKIRYRRWGFIIIIIVSVLIGAKFNQDKFDLLYAAIEYRMGETLEKQDSVTTQPSFRWNMNKGALEAISHKPLMGYGFLNSKEIWDKVDSGIPNWWKHRPHNIYLVIAVEGGIFACAFFIIITLLPIYKLIFNFKKLDPLRFAFLFSLLSCFSFSQFYLTTISPAFAPLYLLLLGASMGYVDYEKERANLEIKYYKIENIRNN